MLTSVGKCWAWLNKQLACSCGWVASTAKMHSQKHTHTNKTEHHHTICIHHHCTKSVLTNAFVHIASDTLNKGHFPS